DKDTTRKRRFGLQPAHKGAPKFQVQVFCQLPELPARSLAHRRKLAVIRDAHVTRLQSVAPGKVCGGNLEFSGSLREMNCGNNAQPAATTDAIENSIENTAAGRD